MWVDMHWHARDFGHNHKDTVLHALEVAYAAGLDAIGAMPNTVPPLVDLESCQAYLGLAKDSKVPTRFYTHIGLTTDLEQVKRAVAATREDSRICGIKTFFGRSTGPLSVIEEDAQRAVWKTVATEGYDGVMVGHFEEEGLMCDTAYQIHKPGSWNRDARPEIAEITSFGKQYQFAQEAGFKGIMHVAHISTLPVVDYIVSSRERSDLHREHFTLSCGVTPHHLFLNEDDLEREGAWLKCNPPLRACRTQEGLLARVMDGRIPIIESDHAPHTGHDKAHVMSPASGVMAGPMWPYIIRKMRKSGMSEERIHAAAFQNAVDTYGLHIEPIEREIDWQLLEKVCAPYRETGALIPFMGDNILGDNSIEGSNDTNIVKLKWK